jgi:peptide/nickel transport system permease protein
MTGTDPAVLMAGGRRMTPETLEAIRVKYNLDRSLPVQYATWLGGALRGDLGESYKLKQSVSSLIAARLPATVELVVLGMVLSLLVAVPFGIVAALKQGTWIDRLITGFALAALSSPVFLTGIFGILIFAYTLGWLPAFGSGGAFPGNLRYFILPSSALALNMIALSLRMTRSGMVEALASDYVRTAVVKGLSKRVVVLKHAFANALVPLVTVAGLQIGFLLTGTVLVEYTFGIAGIGSLLVTAIKNADYPVIQGTTLFVVAAFLVINLIVDLLYAAIDPRIRYR